MHIRVVLINLIFNATNVAAYVSLYSNLVHVKPYSATQNRQRGNFCKLRCRMVDYDTSILKNPLNSQVNQYVNNWEKYSGKEVRSNKDRTKAKPRTYVQCAANEKKTTNERETEIHKLMVWSIPFSCVLHTQKKCVRMEPVAVVETQSSRAIVSVLWSNSYLWRANVSCDCVYLFVIVSSSTFRWYFPCSLMHTDGRKRSGVRNSSSSGSITHCIFSSTAAAACEYFYVSVFTNCRKEGITATTSAKQIQTPVSLFFTNLLAAIFVVQSYRYVDAFGVS